MSVVVSMIHSRTAAQDRTNWILLIIQNPHTFTHIAFTELTGIIIIKSFKVRTFFLLPHILSSPQWMTFRFWSSVSFALVAVSPSMSSFILHYFSLSAGCFFVYLFWCFLDFVGLFLLQLILERTRGKYFTSNAAFFCGSFKLLAFRKWWFFSKLLPCDIHCLLKARECQSFRLQQYYPCKLRTVREFSRQLFS